MLGASAREAGGSGPGRADHHALGEREVAAALDEQDVDHAGDQHSALVESHRRPPFADLAVELEFMHRDAITHGGELVLRGAEPVAAGGEPVGEGALAESLEHAWAVAIAHERSLRIDRALFSAAYFLEGRPAAAA
jgi:hypothetical protein